MDKLIKYCMKFWLSNDTSHMFENIKKEYILENLENEKWENARKLFIIMLRKKLKKYNIIILKSDFDATGIIAKCLRKSNISTFMTVPDLKWKIYKISENKYKIKIYKSKKIIMTRYIF